MFIVISAMGSAINCLLNGDVRGVQASTRNVSSLANIVPDDLTKDDLERLNEDGDYGSSYLKWVNALDKLNSAINKQCSDLDSPFPDYKLSKKVFERNPLWKSACEKEFISLFTSLFDGIKSIDNKYIDLKILLNHTVDSAKSDVLKIYEKYKPYRLSKFSKVFSKYTKDKVLFARLTFLKSLLYAVTGFQKSLIECGYKSHPFVIFLKFLKKKCEDDKKLVNKL